jgi:hypothetical protein
MSEYILDLSEADIGNLPQELRNFKIPVRTGQHQLEYDLIECDIPKDIYNKMINGLSGDNESMPIGFNLYEMPTGAKLIMVKK